MPPPSHLLSSTIWKPGLAGSKPTQMSSETRNVTIVVQNAM